MKRHHEDNPYSSNDNVDNLTNHSMPKRMATRNNSQSNSTNAYSISVNYSPPSSIGSDSSSSSSSLSSTNYQNSPSNQLCRCPNEDCVIHHNQHSKDVPSELRLNSNPIYGNNNLLLYYAHLERCRRYGLNIHQHTSSSSSS